VPNQNGIEAKPQTGFGNFAHCFSAEIRYRNVAAFIERNGSRSAASVRFLQAAVILHIGGVAFNPQD